MTELNTISIEKRNLVQITRFLESLSLVGAVSRARTKLAKDLNESITEVGEQETELAREMGGVVSDQGNIKFPETDEGTIQQKQFRDEQVKLLSEKVVLAEYTEGYFEKLQTALENYDQALSEQEAVIYDTLLDALEAEGE